MKKVISTLLAASMMLLGTQAFAQVSVHAGYLNTTAAQETKSVNGHGAYAGLSFNLPVAGGLAIAPGVYYSMITSKTSELWGFASGTLMEHAVNVPVYLNYGIEMNRDTKFFVFGGPTLQYGLASSTKHDVSAVGVSGTENNYDNSSYNRMNVYLGGGIGVDVSGLMVTVGYDYGMMNQYKGDNVPKCHRSNLKIGVGFAF